MAEALKFSKAKKHRKKYIIGVVIAFVLLLLVIPMLLTTYMHNVVFEQRAESPKYRAFLRHDDVSGYARQIVNFPSGSNLLTGYIYGEDNYKGLVVISHSFGDGEEGYFNVVRYFVENGWRVFTFDKTGSHNSEGHGTVGLTQPVLDLDAALTFIEEQEWGLPIVLFGHSMGGFAVTIVLTFDHEIHAVVSLAGYNRPILVLQDMANRMLGPVGNLAYPYLWLHQRLLFGRNANLSAVAGINNSDIPIMIIHGTGDMLISYDRAGIIAHRNEITNPNVLFISHDSAHHNTHMNLLVSEEASAYINQLNEIFRSLYNLYVREHYEACPFISIHYHHVHMITNPNLARCFCTQTYSVYIPEHVLSEFYANIDRQRTSALNLLLMDQINTFFEDAIR